MYGAKPVESWISTGRDFTHIKDYAEESLEELLAITSAPKAVWSENLSDGSTVGNNRQIRRNNYM